MSRCEGCQAEGVTTYTADFGVPGGDRGMGLAPVELSMCVECHPELDGRPPYDSPPPFCGRETADGSPCKNIYPLKPWERGIKSRRPWTPCHLHGDTGWPDPEEIPHYDRADWAQDDPDGEQ